MKDDLLAIIRADFPNLPIGDARLATSGWDHDVVIIDETWVFRFASDDDPTFEPELAVLDRLRGKTTLPIPAVEFRGRSARYIGYRIVRGSDLTSEVYRGLSSTQKATLAFDLARFLVEVHRTISVDDALRLGVPVDDPMSCLAECLSLVSRIADRHVAAFLAETFAEFEESLSAPGPRSFLYNDLHGDNMGFDVDAGRVNGIFDFGDIAVGDVHREFGPLYRIDRELLEATVHEYERMTGTSLSLRRSVLSQRMDRIADLTILDEETGAAEIERVYAELRHWMGERDIYR